MNAILRPTGAGLPEAAFEPMTPDWLDAVLAIEATAYPHPWTRGNFTDSLRAGYQAQMLVADKQAQLHTMLKHLIDQLLR